MLRKGQVSTAKRRSGNGGMETSRRQRPSMPAKRPGLESGSSRGPRLEVLFRKQLLCQVRSLRERVCSWRVIEALAMGAQPFAL